MKHLSNNLNLWGLKDSISDYLTVLDCVLIPSQEDLSIVALEVMTAGGRVVSPKQTGAFELLIQSGCGIFYEDNNNLMNTAETIVKAISGQNNVIVKN